MTKPTRPVANASLGNAPGKNGKGAGICTEESEDDDVLPNRGPLYEAGRFDPWPASMLRQDPLLPSAAVQLQVKKILPAAMNIVGPLGSELSIPELKRISELPRWQLQNKYIAKGLRSARSRFIGSRLLEIISRYERVRKIEELQSVPEFRTKHTQIVRLAEALKAAITDDSDLRLSLLTNQLLRMDRIRLVKSNRYAKVDFLSVESILEILIHRATPYAEIIGKQGRYVDECALYCSRDLAETWEALAAKPFPRTFRTERASGKEFFKSPAAHFVHQIFLLIDPSVKMEPCLRRCKLILVFPS